MWTLALHKSVTESLVAELTPVPVADRLDHILAQIAAVGLKSRGESSLERFMLCQFALAFHVQKGGLTFKVANELIELSRAIMKLQGDLVVTGSLAWISGEMHILMGQVYSSFGRRWDALWQQEYGLHFGVRKEQAHKSFASYTLGNRLMRLGYAKEALQHYREVKSEGRGDTTSQKTKVALIRALFVSGDLTGAMQISEEMLGAAPTADSAEEVAWGLELYRCLEKGDLADLLKFVRKKECYKHPSYQLELALWMYSWPDDRYLGKVPSARYLRSKFGAHHGNVKEFLRVVEVLQELYEDSGKVVLKIDKVEFLLSNKNLLSTVDKEILLLMAVYRWLKKAKWTRLARFAELDLKSLGFRISQVADFNFWGLLKP